MSFINRKKREIRVNDVKLSAFVITSSEVAITLHFSPSYGLSQSKIMEISIHVIMYTIVLQTTVYTDLDFCHTLRQIRAYFRDK